MATRTTNYNLIKPDLTDDADIRVINGNMDVLDNTLKTINDSITTKTNNAFTDLSVNSNYEWKFTKASGSNVSYDTIKYAIYAKHLDGSVDTYLPNTKSYANSKLDYYYGTVPNKGTSTTLDCGVLKFNHWSSTPWNTALIVPNNANNRPYFAYQNGVSGTNYTTYSELALKSDVDAKLNSSGGNVSGNIYTTANIYKKTNNSSLLIGGSIDSNSGARILLNGEKNNRGVIQLTAASDDGNSNTMKIDSKNGYYEFNGLGCWFNGVADYFRIGNDDEHYLSFYRGDNTIRCMASNLLVNNKKVPTYAKEVTYAGTVSNTASHDAYVQFSDGTLIQWGIYNADSPLRVQTRHINLPIPYANNGYTAVVNQHRSSSAAKQTTTALYADYDDGNKLICWFTIGQGVM